MLLRDFMVIDARFVTFADILQVFRDYCEGKKVVWEWVEDELLPPER